MKTTSRSGWVSRLDLAAHLGLTGRVDQDRVDQVDRVDRVDRAGRGRSTGALHRLGRDAAA